MGKKKFTWSPYLLILPSFLYLGLFFIWPVGSSIRLAFTSTTRVLNVYAIPDEATESVGTLPMQTMVDVLDREEVVIREINAILKETEQWLLVTGEDEAGNVIEGWAPRRNIFVEDFASSESGRVQYGDPVESFTLDHIKTMFGDPRFSKALWTTLILIVCILPIQFALAIVMALVLQERLRGNSIFLYIFAIPLGVSDLAAGLIFFWIFTQSGYLNSFLDTVGLIDKPFIFIGASKEAWMIFAIVLAEVWRATSIVMVIVVSGLQAIPRDFLEAGQLFGASLWQRLRYVILPLLKPSLQVALILRTILAFQVFSVVLAISGGEVMTVLANETYRWYDPEKFNNPNVAAAYATFIMVISLSIAVFYLRAVRTQQEIEA